RFTAGSPRVHETGKVGLFTGRDDRDLPATSAVASRPTIPAIPTRAASATGASRGARRSARAGIAVGPARAARAARFDHDPVGRWYRVRIREHEEGRGIFDLDAHHEQPLIER